MRLPGLALLAVLALLVALTGAVSGHDKELPHKKLFEARWHYEVEGGDYESWMALITGQPSYNCDTEATCRSRWSPPFAQAIDDWNNQPMTVAHLLQPDDSPLYDTNVYIEDLLFDDPMLLGFDNALDVDGNLCLDQTCAVWAEDVYIGDDAHSGMFGTMAQRRGTIAHELGHGMSLRHESVNDDESVLYPCNADDTGLIPRSIMSYNCIDPIGFGGLGISEVQAWDVCGVNHAYHDPTLGFARCEDVVAIAPAGDANCDGASDAIDAALILQWTAGRLNELSCDAADADLDGTVDAVDAALVLQYVARLIVALPPQ
jgi:hypothetical protein